MFDYLQMTHISFNYVIVDNDTACAENSLISDLYQLDQLSKQWIVAFNPMIMLISQGKFTPSICKFGKNGPTIESSHNHTQLGVNFQSSTSWKFRIQTVYEKACNILRMLKHVLCREALIKNYVIFLTNFRIWRYNLGQLNERDVALLEDVQITATWIITV